MGFGEIIKRSWKITWRYKALWVLGLFAGITGASSGGGSTGSSPNFGSSGSGSSGSGFSGGLPSELNPRAWLPAVERLLPVIVVATVGLVVIGLVWWVLSVAARGGLVHAVNVIEEGGVFTLGAAWNAGFGRFWGLFLLGLLLSLPLAILGLGMAAAILLPILLPLLRGGTPTAAAAVPICGSLAIGVPLLIVLGVVLGLMHELALRFVMLHGMSATAAIGESWRAFRGRFKDTILMWLINLGLNVAAGLALAIPLIIITVALIVPAVFTGVSGNWTAFAMVLVVAFVIIMVLTLLFTAIWGTYTSALWTIFFRRFTGMEVVAATAALAAAAPAPSLTPQPPAPPAPPATPAPLGSPQPPVAPPMAPPPAPPAGEPAT